MKNPDVGTIIRCSSDHVTFRGSNVPCIRVEDDGYGWRVLPVGANHGLFVFITSPAVIALDRIKAVRIIESQPNVAKAELA